MSCPRRILTPGAKLAVVGAVLWVIGLIIIASGVLNK